MQVEVVELEGDDTTGILVHDETNPVLANLLARMRPPYPVAMGVIFRISRPTYDGAVHEQLDVAKASPGAGDITKAIYSGNTWVVE